jgi:hypothetical protein
VSEIRTGKEEVVAALKAAGLDAFSEAPGRSSENIVVVEPGSPYIEGGTGKTFTDYTIRFDIAVVGPSVTAEQGLSDLEDLIEQVILAVDGICNLESVEQPGFITPDSATYHAAVVTVTANITFTEVN